jgi:hypothetical protein
MIWQGQCISITLLCLKVLYGGENACFSSLHTLGVKDTILNLEKGHVTPFGGG